MKQNINIEYTEEEFKSVWGFFTHFIDSGTSLIREGMKLDFERRVNDDKKDKVEKLKGKFQDHKNDIFEQIQELKEDLEELQDTKKSIRDIQKTLAMISMQLEQLEDNQSDDVTPSSFNTRI